DAGGDMDTREPTNPGEAAECSPTAACPSGERCENGRCVSNEICADDADCGGGAYCERGQCQLGCTDNNDCAGERVCGEDNRCTNPDEPPTSGPVECTASADCEPCELCVSGTCQIVDKIC